MSARDSESFDLFEALFRPGIRVQLNWALLGAALPTASLRSVREPTNLGDWILPWYTDRRGREVLYDHADAHPVSLADELSGLAEKRIARIDALEQVLMRGIRPVDLILPTYNLPGNRELILDSSHRAAALARGNIPFRCLAVSVIGPIDPAILPDLAHWAE